MSSVAVYTFDTTREAAQARVALKKLEKRGLMAADDALVVVREASGQIRRQRGLSARMLFGAIVGGLVGMPLVFMFTPISILFGAAVGGAIGRLADGPRLDEEVVDSTEGALQPGTSALLVLPRQGNIAEMDAAMRGLPLHIRRAILTADAGAMLRETLK
jgi:uncharacterized membrane protein